MPPLRRTTLRLTLACCLGTALVACGGSRSADATPHPIVWDRATVMSPTSLRVDWTGSACEELVDATAVESSTAVTVLGCGRAGCLTPPPAPTGT